MLRATVAAAFLTATLAGPTLAIPARSVEGRVSIAGLDLSDPAGVAKLNQRIEQAARDLCTGDLHRDLWSSREVTACQESVVASAKAKLRRLVAANCDQQQVAARRE